MMKKRGQEREEGDRGKRLKQVDDKDIVEEFTSILDNALKLGADAAVVCIESADVLGIYEK